MPFTIGGDWVPEVNNEKKHPSKPIKILKERRGQSIVTLIQNLPLDISELKTLCAKLKQRLGCGGAVKDEKIEIQGDKIEQVQLILKDEGFKIKK